MMLVVTCVPVLVAVVVMAVVVIEAHTVSIKWSVSTS
jgi:hypothetical protein